MDYNGVAFFYCLISLHDVFLFFRQHRGKVVGLAYAPAGDYLYSAGSLGSIAMYDASDNKYQLLRLLGNTLARGETHGPEALAVSLDGKHVAFVGPTNFTISIVEARSLDEVNTPLCMHFYVVYYIDKRRSFAQ